MNRTGLHISLLLSLSLLLGGCTGTSTRIAQHDNLHWPPAPATAKIRFEQAFSTPQELGIGRGFWQWLGDVVFGAETDHMVRPMAVVTVGERLIYVADPGVRGVHRFDTQQHSYQLIKGKNGLELPSPVALAVDSENNVYISDSKLAQLLVVTKDSDHALPVKLNTDLQQPTGIAIEPSSGDLYLVDTRQHQVLVFKRPNPLQAELKHRFGQRGGQPGEFNYPTLIWQQQGTLLVTDALNFRVQLFDLKGDYLSRFGEAGQASGYQSRPKGIAMDQAGHIYLVDALFHNVQLFERDGRFLLSMGEQGQQPGQFWLPAGIHISPQQKIYVADSHNRRVQVFSYLGDNQ